jgi:DNA gyrase/topoisomerase IV subunit A
LREWFEARKATTIVDLKYQQSRLLVNARKAEALIILKDNMEDVQRIFRESKTWTDAIKPLSEKYNLTSFQVKYLSEVPMKQTSIKARDELVEELKNAKLALEGLRSKFRNIIDVMVEDVKYVYNKRNKYHVLSVDRKLKIPNFKTFAVYKDGVLKLDESEIVKFKSEKRDHYPYKIITPSEKYTKCLCVEKVGKVISDDVELFGKEFACSRFQYFSFVPKQIASKINGKWVLKPIKRAVTLDYPLGDEVVYMTNDKLLKKSRLSELNGRMLNNIYTFANDNPDGDYHVIYGIR